MKRSIFKWSFFLLFALLIAACKREEPTSWNTHVLSPIAHGRLTLTDIIPDSLIVYDENCLWHLHFSEDLTDFDLDTLVTIPDTVIKRAFIVPLVGGPVTIPAGQQIIDQEENNQLRMNSTKLREVIVRSGVLEYSIRSHINGYLDCAYDIPGIMLNGVGTTIETVTQPGSGANPYVHSGSINLANYRIDLTGQSGLLYNRIYTHLNLSSAENAPTETVVSSNDSIVIEIKFVDPVISYARGYFGQHYYDLNESLDFSEDFDFPDGQLNLQSATMNLSIRNAVGVDARMQFNELSNYSNYTNTSVSLNHDPLFQPLNITRAFDNNGSIEATEYYYQMDIVNSNIDAFIENLPDQFNLQAQIEINPLGDVTDGNDFIYTSDALKATLDLDIPLNIGMSNLILSDTVDISAEPGEIEADGKIYLLIENAFPFSAKCDLFLIDDDNNQRSISTNQLIDFAIETDVDGITIPVKSVITLPVNQELIDRFTNDQRLCIQVTFNTPDLNETSGLYKNYYIDFKVVADGNILVKYD